MLLHTPTHGTIISSHNAMSSHCINDDDKFVTPPRQNTQADYIIDAPKKRFYTENDEIHTKRRWVISNTDHCVINLNKIFDELATDKCYHNEYYSNNDNNTDEECIISQWRFPTGYFDNCDDDDDDTADNNSLMNY